MASRGRLTSSPAVAEIVGRRDKGQSIAIQWVSGDPVYFGFDEAAKAPEGIFVSSAVPGVVLDGKWAEAASITYISAAAEAGVFNYDII